MNHSAALYNAYQVYADLATPVRNAAKVTAPFLDIPWPCVPESVVAKNIWAACEVIALAGLTHERIPFGIESVFVNEREVPVTEKIVLATPFCSLLRLTKETHTRLPRVLLVAPMSGHFATLLRETVRTLLRDHEVYVSDWHNVRDTPVSEGTFGVDDYIDHIIRFLETTGPGTHVIAVCQPTVASVVATALLAEDGSEVQPASLTLMAGPVDCRISPTEVNHMAVSKPFAWFERNLITTVPLRYDGAGRDVYPGFLQLASFMSMNLKRHVNSFRDLYNSLVSSDIEKSETVKAFYDEYFAVMDLPAEYYLETIRTIFQEYHLPRGMFRYRGRLIDPGAIRRTPLFTVEGEKDDICAVGQTLAAQDLFSGLRPYMKQHHVQTGVGHFGVFSGRRWENEIYPRLRDFIHASESLGLTTAAGSIAA